MTYHFYSFVYFISLFLGNYTFQNIYPGFVTSFACLIFDFLNKIPLKQERLITLVLFLIVAFFTLDTGVVIDVPLAWLMAAMTLSWPLFFTKYENKILNLSPFMLCLFPLIFSLACLFSSDLILSLAGRNNIYRLILSVYCMSVVTTVTGLSRYRGYSLARSLWPFSLLISFVFIIYEIVSLGSRFGIILLIPLLPIVIVAISPLAFQQIIASLHISLSKILSQFSSLFRKKSFYIYASLFLALVFAFAYFLQFALNAFVSERILNYIEMYISSLDDGSTFQDILFSQSGARLRYYEIASNGFSLFGQLSPLTFNPHNFFLDIMHNYGLLFFTLYIYSLVCFFSSRLLSLSVKSFYLFLLLPALSSGFMAENFPLLAVIPFGINGLFNLWITDK